MEVHHQKTRIPKGKLILLALLMVCMVVATGFGGYYWRDRDAKRQIKDKETAMAQLEKEKADLKKELAKKAASPTPEKKAAMPSATKPSADALAAIKSAVTTKNYAALQDYMAGTVRVIFAASEGVGDRTPAQAVADLAYLNGATPPWDFSLPAAELTAYRGGFYGSYFPADALVGKSNDAMVVSFVFNAAGKISGIFVAANADLL